jgi:hypothetical protein
VRRLYCSIKEGERESVFVFYFFFFFSFGVFYLLKKKTGIWLVTRRQRIAIFFYGKLYFSPCKGKMFTSVLYSLKPFNMILVFPKSIQFNNLSVRI